MTTTETVETINCRRGTVTLTTTDAGWTIRGVANASSKRVFTYKVSRCMCLDGNVAAEVIMCNRPPHGGRCTVDAAQLYHCNKSHRGHDGMVRLVLADVVKSYTAPIRTDKAAHNAILTQVAHSHRVGLTGAERVEFDACRVVDAA